MLMLSNHEQRLENFVLSQLEGSAGGITFTFDGRDQALLSQQLSYFHDSFEEFLKLEEGY